MSDIKEISKNIIIEINRIREQEKTQFFVHQDIDSTVDQIELFEIYEKKMNSIVEILRNPSLMSQDQIRSKLIQFHHYLNEYADLIMIVDRVMMQYIKNSSC